ncbi:hypothetical protein AB0N14_37670 [Streptomyces sp. NPDC051104]|uniref:hypothetical protein n=1 Tax=Streptomyces sp. NPDC051104 TaxID=3155044 RepID=UPI0034416D29
MTAIGSDPIGECVQSFLSARHERDGGAERGQLSDVASLTDRASRLNMRCRLARDFGLGTSRWHTSSTVSRGGDRVATMAADETSIKVSAAARDRLAVLAAEHGTTIRGLVEELAQNTPTHAEYAERAELARAELASALGGAPSPEAEAKARALLERLGAAQHGSQAAA